MKLWNANSKGKLTQAIIKGTIEEWESWFLGSDDEGNPKKWSAGRFKQKVLMVSINELGTLHPKTSFDLTTIKAGRKVVGYRLEIVPRNNTSRSSLAIILLLNTIIKLNHPQAKISYILLYFPNLVLRYRLLEEKFLYS